MRWMGLVLVAGLAGCSCGEEPLHHVPGANCIIDDRGGFCQAGHCTLIVKPGALARSTEFILSEDPKPATLIGDVIGDRLCTVGPEGIGLAFLLPAQLRLGYQQAEVPPGLREDELLAFVVNGSRQNLQPGGLQDVTADEVEVPVLAPLSAGLTAVPKAPAVKEEIGLDRFPIGDPASYYRNLSRQPILAAFFDGKRFYLGNGPRVLIWSNGIPADPASPPDLVLGKPDLVTDVPEASASSIVGVVAGLWSDGARLAVSAGNRVLIWNRVPEQSYAAADLVLGQDDFRGGEANRGGLPDASSLFSPDDIASDGTRLAVADSSNNRVLVWNSFPVLNNQPADLVIGQPSLGSNTARVGAIPLQQSRGVYFDAQHFLVDSTFGASCVFGITGFPSSSNPAFDFTIGPNSAAKRVDGAYSSPSGMSRIGPAGLALRDLAGSRVSIWESVPTEATAPPDIILGKPDGVLGGIELGGVSASSLVSTNVAAGVFADEHLVLVPDGARLLIWSNLPAHHYAPADLVIGQPAFTTAEVGVDYRGISRATLAHPTGIAARAGKVVVADRSNNRVLIYSATATTGAAVVLGQVDGAHYSPNRDFHQVSAASLNAPSDVAFDGTRLVVADAGNQRVLIWNALPSVDGAPADLVLGQASFTENKPNRGHIDADQDGDFDASADSLFYPAGLAIDGDTLYIADTFNHRVLAFRPFPTQSGAPATKVLGQADFEANDPNRGLGWFVRSGQSFALPLGLAIGDRGRLYVADQENNRVLGFDDPVGADDLADAIFGQVNVTANASPSYLGGGNLGYPQSETAFVTDATSLRRPSDVSVVGGRIFVSDTSNHRVVAYAETATRAPVTAQLILGQQSPSARSVDAGGLSERSLEAPAGVAGDVDRLWVSDTNNHRVLRFDLASLTSTPAASAVLGQVDFLGDRINGSATAKDVLDRPSGVARDSSGQLWIADRGHHRVLAYKDGAFVLALGQKNLDRALVNSGIPVDGRTLAQPSDLWTDGRRLVVVDRDNHRVLIWKALPTATFTAADVVIGQSDLGGHEMNGGRGPLSPGRDTLLAPEGVGSDGQRLYIADTGNNRVLVYDAFPETSGAPASSVLCQASFAANLPNRGLAALDADRCAQPSDVTPVGTELYVADSQNHRVLIFRAGEDTAHRVLGQADMLSRATSNAAGGIDLSTLQNPSSVASDGQNLFVVDLGNHRILIYDREPSTNGQAADRVLGQPNGTLGVSTSDRASLRVPSRILVESLSFHRTLVTVADAGKDRLVVFEGVARLE
ncbi:MAG: NHL repeat-containing protein [Myxococcota bacterium]